MGCDDKGPGVRFAQPLSVRRVNQCPTAPTAPTAPTNQCPSIIETSLTATSTVATAR